ncbi:MAG: dTDP-4-dehydrorhamnose 3,5-epimerase [Xanthomonadales bacterium]|nr:dTDP-4-dehydrorhamnose 3,5-epimerase [Xanthomonadales bacterium]
MRVLETGLDGVVIIEPRVHGDERGFFLESWKASSYVQHGLPGTFAQTNVSRSQKGVLRGLHYQYRQPQGKLVSVLEGRIFDVAVDVRRSSVSFGQWAGVELSAQNHRQLYVPEGFAHGFIVLSDSALFHYYCTTEYAPEFEAAIAWNDPDIAVRWPSEPRSFSGKDREAPRLRDVPPERLPMDVK